MKLDPTPVFESLWEFAHERQNIFFKRLNGESPPFTSNEILQEFSFTNPYRITDRVSQYLVKNVIYSHCQSAPEVLFRILLFKLFNSIGTWELLESQFGTPSIHSFDIGEYDRVLTNAKQSGAKIYSGAYIMPSGKSTFGSNRKHYNHLTLLNEIMSANPIKEIEKMNTLRELYEFLLSKPTIGRFLAFQFAIDINYSEITNFEESEFVIAGPGALSGIFKCFKHFEARFAEKIIFRLFLDQENEFKKRGLAFKFLHGRKLQPIDIQNLFCELDKYARVKHKDIEGLSSRKRIKRKFRMNPDPIEYFYPPKWDLKFS